MASFSNLQIVLELCELEFQLNFAGKMVIQLKWAKINCNTVILNYKLTQNGVFVVQ